MPALTPAARPLDQALAVLFARSGWTQDMLAKKEGKSQRWISYRLTFGHFLTFSTTVLNLETLPNNLRFGQFLSFWPVGQNSENLPTNLTERRFPSPSCSPAATGRKKIWRRRKGRLDPTWRGCFCLVGF